MAAWSGCCFYFMRGWVVVMSWHAYLRPESYISSWQESSARAKWKGDGQEKSKGVAIN